MQNPLSELGARNVYKSYGNVQALRDVSFDVGSGITVLLGRNGAGKSTLMRIITTLEMPDRGMIVRNRREVNGQQRTAHLATTGFLPQTFGFPPSMRVADFIAYMAWLKGCPTSRIQTLSEKALNAVELGDSGRSRLGQLSGGMLKRVGIAQAIVHEPTLLVLDEPTAGLDPEQRVVFHELLLSLGRRATVVISTHMMEDVVFLADRVALIASGAMRFTGSLADLMAHGQGADDLSRARSAFIGLSVE